MLYYYYVFLHEQDCYLYVTTLLLHDNHRKFNLFMKGVNFMERKELVLKTVFFIFVFDLAICSIFAICSVIFGDTLGQTFLPILPALVYSNLLLYLFIYSDNKRKAIIKKNTEFTKSQLSEYKWTEVVPIAASNYKDFILALPNHAKFYAILSNEEVMIEIQFNNNEAPIFFESLYVSQFPYFYKIL